jgi:hypothetical protein
MTSALWVFCTCSQNHGVMKKHFFTGWQEEGFDTTEISLMWWIWICSTETDVLALGYDTLGVSGYIFRFFVLTCMVILHVYLDKMMFYNQIPADLAPLEKMFDKHACIRKRNKCPSLMNIWKSTMDLLVALIL